MDMKKVGVVGAGMMGAEIALCFAQKQIPVILSDATLELAEKGKERIEAILDKEIAKGRCPAEAKRTYLDQIRPAGSLDPMTGCDFIIEAVREDPEIKSSVFKALDDRCKPECIIASNTSSISITKLASAVSEERAERFLGAHFNSPASVMKLVEVVPGMHTTSETVGLTVGLLNSIEKETVIVKDVVGFGLNRLLHVFVAEACRLVEEGVCSVEDVDKICQHGLGHPIGVFRLIDHTGLDLNLAVEKIMFDAYGERFRPSPTLQRMVDSNRLGRKSGRGFYDYRQK